MRQQLSFSFLILSFLSLAYCPNMVAQGSKNINLLGQLSYPNELNDIWGYANALGEEYALVGLTNGVSIVDIQDPTQPQALHFIPGANSVWRDLKTYQDFAYVTNETDSGLLVIDLRYLPDSVAWKDTVIAGTTTAHNVYMDAGRLYVSGPNTFNGGIMILDVSADPWHPDYLGNYDDNYVHDVYVRQEIAYTGEIYTGQLGIVDVSDPEAPEILDKRRYAGGFTHNTWLNDAGNVCFTTDEYSGAYVIAWDVSDPTNIEELDRIRSSVSQETAAPHNVHVLNDFLVTSYYKDGVHLTDASMPGNLVEVGYYDTSPLDSTGLDGAWGAYPFLPSGRILVTDQQEGLFILEPDYVRGCYLEGNVFDEETNDPLSLVDINILNSTVAGASLNDGTFALGVADSGSYEVEMSLYGYETDTFVVVLDNGSLTSLNAPLKPTPRVDLSIEVRESGSNQLLSGVQVEAIAQNDAARFTYFTDGDGHILVDRFVVNEYTFTVGNWGHQTQRITTQIDSTQATLSFVLDPGYYDDFSLDFGWEESGTALRGRWVRGEPIGTYETLFNWGIQNPEFDIPNDIGDQCYMTGNAGGLAFGDDVDRGFTWLSSPPIDLAQTGYDHPRILLSWWLLNWSLNGDLPPGPGDDFLRISLTDEVDTFVVRQYIGPWDTAWSVADIRITNYFPANSTIRMLIYAQDLEQNNQDAVEAAIDGFRIVEGFPVSNTPIVDELEWRAWSTEGVVRLEYDLVGQGAGWSWQLMDLHGRTLVEAPLTGPSGKQAFHQPIPAGVYLVSLRQDGQVRSIRKISVL